LITLLKRNGNLDRMNRISRGFKEDM